MAPNIPGSFKLVHTTLPQFVKSPIQRQSFYLGAAGAQFAMQGKLDDVRIYNRALSPAEVKQLYKLGTVIIRQ